MTARLKAAMAKNRAKVRKQQLAIFGKRICVFRCMDFSFYRGFSGCVVGEKIAAWYRYAIKKKMPFVMIYKSGGARMRSCFVFK